MQSTQFLKGLSWRLRSTAFLTLIFLCTHASAYNSYEAAILADGPIGYWSLDEAGSEPVADNLGTLGGIADGDYFGDFVFPDPGPGHIGLGSGNKAIRLDGLDTSGVNVAEPILDGFRAFTLSGWINPAQQELSNRSGIFGQDNAIEFGFIGPSNIQFWAELPNGGGMSADIPYSFPNDEWHHIAGTYDADSGDFAAYIDSVEQTPAVNTFIPLDDSGFVEFNSSENPFNIGGGPIFGDDTQYLGAIDEISVFDRFLTQSEIQAHFDAAFEEPTLSGGIDFLTLILSDTNLNKGNANSLQSKLNAALKTAGDGRPNTLNILKAFVHEVDALSGVKLDPGDADRLKAEALEIIGQFGTDTIPIPEPSSLVLILLGAGLLFKNQRLRFVKR